MYGLVRACDDAAVTVDAAAAEVVAINWTSSLRIVVFVSHELPLFATVRCGTTAATATTLLLFAVVDDVADDDVVISHVNATIDVDVAADDDIDDDDGGDDVDTVERAAASNGTAVVVVVVADNGLVIAAVTCTTLTTWLLVAATNDTDRIVLLLLTAVATRAASADAEVVCGISGGIGGTTPITSVDDGADNIVEEATVDIVAAVVIVNILME